MKKISLLLILFAFFGIITNAQTTRNLKQVLELRMPMEFGEDNAGTNGASIVWHPIQKKYYAAMAGNINYPLAIFNGSGKRLSPDNLTTRVDLRGLWYNPLKKSICGNGYGNIGWFHYELDPKGTVLEITNDIAVKAQPNDQCVGTFNTQTNEVMFLDGNQVALYSNVGSLNGRIDIHLGLYEKDDIGEDFEPSDKTGESYNYTTVVYTGLKNAEIGVLNVNVAKNQIELYDIKKGFLTTILKLPQMQITYGAFGFAFTNGMYWFFDKDYRIWTAYK